MGVNGIYGLSGSGLDVESMVKVGMMSKENQLTKMQQNYTKNEWKKEAFLDIYKEINDFNMNDLSFYKYSTNMNARSAVSSKDAVKATATSAAATGPHIITIKSTANNAYLVGTLSPEFDVTTINEETEKPETNKVSLKNTGSKTLTLGDLGFNNGLSFSLGRADNTITLESDKSIYDMAAKIKEKGNGVQMSYDSTNGRISFYQTNLGKDYGISITSSDTDTQRFFAALGLKNRNTGTTYTDTSTFGSGITATGQNTSVNIDGWTSDNLTSNNIYVDGITYNIGGVVVENGVPVTAVVNVDQDVETIVDNVKSFIEDYNSLLDKLYDAYSEAPNSSYKPLTDAQKKEMSEDQIKKWEEKAKAGMLYHNQDLRKIIDEVRTSVTSTVSNVSGDYDSIFSIGISTKGLGYNGRLQLDESKLREALAADGEAVYKVFANPNATSGDNSVSGSNGIAVRLSTALSNGTKSIKNVAGTDSSTTSDSTLNTLLKSMQQRISNFQKMMQSYENNLYKRYDAMEVSLASLGSQMNYVSSLFAS